MQIFVSVSCANVSNLIEHITVPAAGGMINNNLQTRRIYWRRASIQDGQAFTRVIGVLELWHAENATST